MTGQTAAYWAGSVVLMAAASVVAWWQGVPLLDMGLLGFACGVTYQIMSKAAGWPSRQWWERR